MQRLAASIFHYGEATVQSVKRKLRVCKHPGAVMNPNFSKGLIPAIVIEEGTKDVYVTS